jgi:hypothetical protein
VRYICIIDTLLNSSNIDIEWQSRTNCHNTYISENKNKTHEFCGNR